MRLLVAWRQDAWTGAGLPSEMISATPGVALTRLLVLADCGGRTARVEPVTRWWRNVSIWRSSRETCIWEIPICSAI
jgi:hypothetical protein